ncbi:hypothetical protein Taro_039690 [Colocasia esculenta]|uniref:DUF7392 domain-containing protein n=1 Tax=Colocasia esculenta TaxID=4460 RepID=A0A843WS80_COLES|nr:hypothetical protein [Colocasia esculenta]
MPCFVPFSNKDLQLSFFIFRHVDVSADDLLDALKLFSFFTEDLGCIYSSIFKTIHGNMIVWYGAWIRRPDLQRRMLSDHLISALANVSHLAVLLDYGFFESYVGESKDGRPFAKFLSGDTISMSAMTPNSSEAMADLSYACIALLKSYYLKNDGITAGVCFSCLDKPMLASMQVWKSLDSCYAWLINSNYRKNIRPYISPLSSDAQYEVFKVMYVSTDELLGINLLPSLKMIRHGDHMHGYQVEEEGEDGKNGTNTA